MSRENAIRKDAIDAIVSVIADAILYDVNPYRISS